MNETQSNSEPVLTVVVRIPDPSGKLTIVEYELPAGCRRIFVDSCGGYSPVTGFLSLSEKESPIEGEFICQRDGMAHG